MDGTAIDPLIIFKGQNVLQSWIPQEVINKWHFSANTNGWTSNLHGVEWLKRVFEPATHAKADEGKQQRLLICDGHDSHISGSFISHCIQNRISLLILPPHTSHVLQPLDVAIFGPLKKHLTTALSHLNEAQLTRIQKAEWLSAYIKARADAFSTQNIASAWRGAGLQPLQPQWVIRMVTIAITGTIDERPKTPQQHDIFETVFQNSSPPDIATLRKANITLATALQARTVLNTPTTRYIQKLADETEQQNTHNFLQQCEVDNLRAIIQTRRKQNKGKRAVLKGHFHISTENLRSQVVAAEEATQQKRTKVATTIATNTQIEEINGNNDIEGSEEELDCIIVEY